MAWCLAEHRDSFNFTFNIFMSDSYDSTESTSSCGVSKLKISQCNAWRSIQRRFKSTGYARLSTLTNYMNHSWEATSKEIPRHLWTLITVFTRAHHWPQSWARTIQSTLFHPISLRRILILSFYLRLGPPSGLFPSGVPTKMLYAFIIPHDNWSPDLKRH
jgi:hypothetical protein